MKKDTKTYNLDLKDINPELAKRVSQHQELNRLVATAGQFFTNALEMKRQGGNFPDKKQIKANINWAMEQINMAKILILDNANQKQ